MESMPYNPLVVVTQEQMKETRDFFGLGNSKQIRENLDAIEEWVSKQEHLAAALPFMNNFILERIFILGKGSIEGTKKKIDKFFTTRAMMPEICLNKNFDEFNNLCQSLTYVPLPKLNPINNSRVMVTLLKSENSDLLTLLSYMRYCYLLGEYRLNFDYNISETFIIDLKNTKNASILTKLNPMVLKKGEVLCTEGYGIKIDGIHLLNAPPFVDKLVFLLKQVLKEKIANRLHVHSTTEDLHKYISKDILPKDYDGDGPSISNLSEQWTEILKSDETKRLIQNTEKLVSDETKRSTKKFNEEYLGMPGSFRKLNVD